MILLCKALLSHGQPGLMRQILQNHISTQCVPFHPYLTLFSYVYYFVEFIYFYIIWRKELSLCLTNHDGQRHICLSGIQTCVHPIANSNLYLHTMGTAVINDIQFKLCQCDLFCKRCQCDLFCKLCQCDLFCKLCQCDLFCNTNLDVTST